jgi:hypothetical protein
LSLAKNDGVEASESEITKKVDSVFTDNKIHGESLHLEEFKKICLRDPWLRHALTKLGVLGPADLIVRFFWIRLLQVFQAGILALDLPEVAEIGTLGKLPVIFFGIWQICGAMVKTNLKCNF